MERAVAKGMRPTREECTVELVLKGAYQDVIKSGGAKKRLVLPKRTNAVVYRALDLIAGLLANTSGLRGMLYWAVGTGDSEWDDSPPTPDQRATRLVNEIYRQAIDPDAIDMIRTRTRLPCSFFWSSTQDWGRFGSSGCSAVMLRHDRERAT